MFHKIFLLLWFPVEQLKLKYGVGQITEDEIFPKCSKKFQCYSSGVFKGENGPLQASFDDSGFVKIAWQNQRSGPDLNNFSVKVFISSSDLLLMCLFIAKKCVQYVKSSVVCFFVSWEYWNNLL